MERVLHLWRHPLGTATGVKVVLHATTPLEEKILGVVWRNCQLQSIRVECRFATVRKKRKVLRIVTAVAFRYMRQMRKWDTILVRRPTRIRYKQRVLFALLVNLVQSNNWWLLPWARYNDATGTTRVVIFQITPPYPEVRVP
jgi:hypothetical protein